MFVAAAANYAIYYTQIDQILKNSESDDVRYELSCLYSTCPSEKSNLGKWYQNPHVFYQNSGIFILKSDFRFTLYYESCISFEKKFYNFYDNNDTVGMRY